MKIKWILDQSMDDDVLEIRAKQIDESLKQWIDQKAAVLSGYDQENKTILKMEEIVAIITENRNVIIKTMNREYQSKQRLYEIETALNDDFIRISQSEFVNVHYIRCFKKTGIRSITLEMENGLLCTISRRYLNEVKRKLEERL